MLSKITAICLFITGLGLSIDGKAAESSFDFKTVADGIYIHHGQHLDIAEGYQGDICNLSVIIGTHAIAVIDSGGSLHTGQQLLTAIRKISPLPIRYVINTHVHPDHIYGNGAFSDENPQYVGHEKLATLMLLRQAQYEKLNASLLGAEGVRSPTIAPNLLVTKNMTLDLGGRTLSLQAHTVAHTHSDLSVVDNKTNTLFTGDLLFAQRTPVLEGDIKGLIQTLETLNQHSYALVVPGHGQESTDQNAIFSNALRYLQALLKDVRNAIQKGVSMEQTMETAASAEHDRWLLFDIANRRNVNVIYPQLEWE